MARDERIAGFARVAAADRIVIEHFATSTDAARSRTWIDALRIDTGLILRAFAAVHAFWLTNWWAAAIAWQARANGISVGQSASAVRAAWRWITWVRWLIVDGRCWSLVV